MADHSWYGCHAAVLMQVLGFDIPKTRYMYGTGIISVIGTSFTFLNVTSQSIGNMMVNPLDTRHSWKDCLNNITFDHTPAPSLCAFTYADAQMQLSCCEVSLMYCAVAAMHYPTQAYKQSLHGRT